MFKLLPLAAAVLFIMIITGLGFLITAESVEYITINPPPSEFVGHYHPNDHSEKGIQPTSELEIDPDSKCKLIAFPVATYLGIDPRHEPKIDNYTGEGTWSVQPYAGRYHVSITLTNGVKFDLRVEKVGSPFNRIRTPYTLCQEGADVDADSLSFTQQRANAK
jgi:hypothetical protein